MKTIFQKFLEFETHHGDEDRQGYVRKKALDYVESKTDVADEWVEVFLCNIGNTAHLLHLGHHRRLICWRVGLFLFFYYLLHSITINRASVYFLVGRVYMTSRRFANKNIERSDQQPKTREWMISCISLLVFKKKQTISVFTFMIESPTTGCFFPTCLWCIWFWRLVNKNKNEMPSLAYGFWRAHSSCHSFFFFSNGKLHDAITSSLLLVRHIWENGEAKKKRKSSSFLIA